MTFPPGNERLNSFIQAVALSKKKEKKTKHFALAHESTVCTCLGYIAFRLSERCLVPISLIFWWHLLFYSIKGELVLCCLDL